MFLQFYFIIDCYSKYFQAIRGLLQIVKCPISFKSLRAKGQFIWMDGIQVFEPEYDLNGDPVYHETFFEAAVARGLVADDGLWIKTIREAFAGISSLRRKINWIAMLLSNAEAENPLDILDRFLDDLVPRRYNDLSTEQRRQFVLRYIEYILRRNGIQPRGIKETSCERIGLPAPINFALTTDETEEVFFLSYLIHLFAKTCYKY